MSSLNLPVFSEIDIRAARIRRIISLYFLELKNRKDICVHKGICLHFEFVISRHPLHPISWFKPGRKLYIFKGCKKDVRGHTFICSACPLKATHRLEGFVDG